MVMSMAIMLRPMEKLTVSKKSSKKFIFHGKKKTQKFKIDMLDEMTQQNTSKFAIFLEYENPCSFFSFHIIFSPNECPA